MSWEDSAACLEVDPDLFFPESSRASAQIKRFCAACPVNVPCLKVAMNERITFGVWGGLDFNERKKLRRDQAA
jgi:WhiB family redox-sensing transcriptional regulator